MLKQINDFLAGIPATIIAGIFLLVDLVPHLSYLFGWNIVLPHIALFNPAWITVIISGIPMLYLAIWRIIKYYIKIFFTHKFL